MYSKSISKNVIKFQKKIIKFDFSNRSLKKLNGIPSNTNWFDLTKNCNNINVVLDNIEKHYKKNFDAIITKKEITIKSKKPFNSYIRHLIKI